MATRLKRPRALLGLSLNTVEDSAAMERQAAQYAADMAEVDRECLSPHLVDDVFTVKPIGRGSTGVVYLACHGPTLRLLALKSVAVGDEAHEAAVMQELHAEHSQLVPLSAEGAPQPLAARQCVSVWSQVLPGP